EPRALPVQRLGGDILEGAVAAVAIELARMTQDLAAAVSRCRRRRVLRPDLELGPRRKLLIVLVEGAAANHEQIEQAVAVEVDQSDAAAELFEDGAVVK